MALLLRGVVGEDKGTVRSEPCEKKVVQTTKQDVLQKSSPSSPLAFSLRALTFPQVDNNTLVIV